MITPHAPLNFVWYSTLLLCCVTTLGACGIKPEFSDPAFSNGLQRDGKQVILTKSTLQLSSQYQGSDISGGTFPRLLDALDVMQSSFFEAWQGTWPTAIDWTAAVLGTQVAAALGAISTSGFPFRENTVNKYFSQIIAFYFGENSFGLRNQAYDDMLWVVLGWLESIKFIHVYSRLHHRDTCDNTSWHGNQFIPAFAHRARIFWDIASTGWDMSLCGGGMLWNPNLAPYKNAITNQLYIAASVSMYLYFPGDSNTSPFTVEQTEKPGSDNPARQRHDQKYLEAAIEAYQWLTKSNMTNVYGLYVDGFHINGWRGGNNGSKGTGKCDIRDEQVYTYNQGVILTGQRGLWEATGNTSYLKDGHRLIRGVISATGWHVKDPEKRRRWAGIGRNGVLEDTCDSSGRCGQDAQAFKGIFFHHLDTFCEPLEVGPNHGVFHRATRVLAKIHEQRCFEYRTWVAHNANAALGTKDRVGKFGMWWTVGLWSRSEVHQWTELDTPSEGTDYRNFGIPKDNIWRQSHESQEKDITCGPAEALVVHKNVYPDAGRDTDLVWDPNSRGRGRTVETQSGGVAVLRTLHRYTG